MIVGDVILTIICTWVVANISSTTSRNLMACHGMGFRVRRSISVMPRMSCVLVCIRRQIGR